MCTSVKYIRYFQTFNTYILQFTLFKFFRSSVKSDLLSYQNYKLGYLLLDLGPYLYRSVICKWLQFPSYLFLWSSRWWENESKPHVLCIDWRNLIYAIIFLLHVETKRRWKHFRSDGKFKICINHADIRKVTHHEIQTNSIFLIGIPSFNLCCCNLRVLYTSHIHSPF